MHDWLIFIINYGQPTWLVIIKNYVKDHAVYIRSSLHHVFKTQRPFIHGIIELSDRKRCHTIAFTFVLLDYVARLWLADLFSISLLFFCSIRSKNNQPAGSWMSNFTRI